MQPQRLFTQPLTFQGNWGEHTSLLSVNQFWALSPRTLRVAVVVG